MGRFVRALLVSAVATGSAYIVMSRLQKKNRVATESPRPRVKEVEAESLPDQVRKDLLTELEGHL